MREEEEEDEEQELEEEDNEDEGKALCDHLKGRLGSRARSGKGIKKERTEGRKNKRKDAKTENCCARHRNIHKARQRGDAATRCDQTLSGST